MYDYIVYQFDYFVRASQSTQYHFTGKIRFITYQLMNVNYVRLLCTIKPVFLTYYDDDVEYQVNCEMNTVYLWPPGSSKIYVNERFVVFTHAECCFIAFPAYVNVC